MCLSTILCTIWFLNLIIIFNVICCFFMHTPGGGWFTITCCVCIILVALLCQPCYSNIKRPVNTAFQILQIIFTKSHCEPSNCDQIVIPAPRWKFSPLNPPETLRRPSSSACPPAFRRIQALGMACGVRVCTFVKCTQTACIEPHYTHWTHILVCFVRSSLVS